MAPKRRGRTPSRKKTSTKLSKSKAKMAAAHNSDKNREQSRTNSHVCQYCSKYFMTTKKLKNHQNNCLMAQQNQYKKLVKPETAKYNCKICNKKFKFINTFETHLEQEHSELPTSLQCDKCPAKCPNQASLEAHKQKCHKDELFACPHCAATFTRNYHVLRHLEQKGCGGKHVKPLVCQICNSVFTRKDNLMYHLRNNHMVDNKTYKCKQCAFGSNNYHKFIRHFTYKHLDPHFECDHCGKLLSSRLSLSKHLEIHGEKKFECSACTYKSHTIEVMKRHLFSHSKDKPIKCPECPRSFIQIHELRVHMIKHTGFKCEYCGEMFKNKNLLTIHIREHQGKEILSCPYASCPYSKKTFAYESSYKEHLNGHQNKPHICEVCSKPFPSEVNLKRHLVTHTLERPRRCMYCTAARAYVRGGRLVRHLRVAHPDIFQEHLAHVRKVLNCVDVGDRLKKSESEAILNMMDALQDRIIGEGWDGKVLYGGIVEQKSDAEKTEESPLMSEEELTESLKKLLVQLIDAPTLKAFSWPDESVDVVLEKVIEQCGQRAADRERWSRVQCLRENAKHLFLHVIEDKDIKRMLGMQTIDQVVRHILNVDIV